MEQEKRETRSVDDAVHELHVLYMRYFSLEDPWQLPMNSAAERHELLDRMGAVVDEILNAEERPSWLHPAMFAGSLATAFCSVPPNPQHRGMLMPSAPDPREVYWSKFSICNHSVPLEEKPFLMAVDYYPPDPTNSQGSSCSPPTASGTSSESGCSSQFHSGSSVTSSKSSVPRVGALPGDRFRDERQIQVERFVGEILRARGIQYNLNDNKTERQAFLYRLPSTNHPDHR